MTSLAGRNFLYSELNTGVYRVDMPIDEADTRKENHGELHTDYHYVSTWIHCQRNK